MTVLLVVSLVLAVVMSLVAWRVARDERARADARVETLASDIQAAVASAGGGRRSEPMLRAVRPARTDNVDLFSGPTSAANSRSVVIVGVGLFIFATIAALAVVLTNGTHGIGTRAPTSAPAPNSVQPASLPSLELQALGHERDGDRLIVRGVVRNPTSAASGAITAVVFAFDHDGGFVTSARATLDTPVLAPGADSTFLVSLPHAEHVVRYRVSFRTDTTIVPHVDKRHG
jgi:hypothetical protein